MTVGERIKQKFGLHAEPKFEMKMEKILCQNANANAQAGPRPMTNAEREKLINYIKGMTSEELKIVADNIPVELCHNRIGAELQKFKQAKKSSKKLISELE